MYHIYIYMGIERGYMGFRVEGSKHLPTKPFKIPWMKGYGAYIGVIWV